jgi:hypothetical protein
MVSSNERGTLDGNREATHTGLVGEPTKPYRGASYALNLGAVLILSKSWIDAGHGSRSSRHCATRWRWHTVAFFASARAADKRWSGRPCPDGGPAIVEKYGGLNNASAYIGMMPGHNLGIVIRGHIPTKIGRCILLDFAGIEHASRCGSPRCNRR